MKPSTLVRSLEAKLWRRQYNQQMRISHESAQSCLHMLVMVTAGKQRPAHLHQRLHGFSCNAANVNSSFFYLFILAPYFLRSNLRARP